MEMIGEPSSHYVALFDYNPRCKQELLLRQDDLVNLIDADRDWSLVENVSAVSPRVSLPGGCRLVGG